MEMLISIQTFIKIFSNEIYRKKLDKIILNFFGLETSNIISGNDIKKDDILLEFLIYINKQFIFKIIVKDINNLFNYSKKFYINFSYEDKKKNYILLYPCYWEFYCNDCLRNKSNQKLLTNFAALLASTNRNEIKSTLKSLKVFNNKEINDIMNMLER